MISSLRRFAEPIMIVGVLALLVGLFLAYRLPEAWRRAEELARPPREVTLNDLVETGAGENPHVIITNFTCADDFAYEAHQRRGSQKISYVSGGWIPLFPKAPADKQAHETEPRKFRILLETSTTVSDPTAAHLLSRRPSIEGLLVPFSRCSASSEIRDILQESYPETDFNQVLVLVQYEGHRLRDVHSSAVALSVMATGSILTGLAIIAFGYFLYRGRPPQAVKRSLRQRPTR